jgi:hypothetical protein
VGVVVVVVWWAGSDVMGGGGDRDADQERRAELGLGDARTKLDECFLAAETNKRECESDAMFMGASVAFATPPFTAAPRKKYYAHGSQDLVARNGNRPARDREKQK